MKNKHTPVLSLRHISKTFGGQRALDDVDLRVEPGEVHGLLGQNGSGKSTLIKVLAGYHTPDAGGQLEINGNPVRFPLQGSDFRKYGLSFVHQDLGLVPALRVVENLYVGNLAAKTSWKISWEQLARDAQAVFDRFGIAIDPLAYVSSLSQVEAAMLAIVRAVEDIRGNFRPTQERLDARVEARRGLLILDEPTVFLPKTGVDQLFRLIREVVAAGASVLFVSHDLDEVLEITDRVTVLRDGRVTDSLITAETSKEQLVESIIGRRLEALEGTAVNESKRSVQFSIRDLTGRVVQDFDTVLRQGEVLGLTGLVGSGFEEIPYLLFGDHKAITGELQMGDTRHALRSMTPEQAISLGMAFLPADRLEAGGVGSLPVVDNLMLQVLNRYQEKFALNRRRLLRDASVLLTQYDVRPNDPNRDLQLLSGGNQQKVLLAKWFQTKPSLLLLHEPTQGVDVGARQQVYEMIRNTTREGMSVICASSDYEQLAAICDRVLVFGRGTVVSELTGSDISKDRITEQCYQSVQFITVTGNGGGVA